MSTTHYALWSKDSLGNMQWNSTNVNNYATSTIHSYLNTTYYNTLPTQDKEKLGTKAMVEEYHGDGIDGISSVNKLLYGWGTLNANVWLPSLIELVGYAGSPDGDGFYLNAMVGFNIDNLYRVDTKGGIQWAYFTQFNAKGGGDRLWDACQQQHTWLRSPHMGMQSRGYRLSGNNRFDWAFVADETWVVHPAVLYNPERPVKRNGFVLIKDV